jgi:hypothetical protein
MAEDTVMSKKNKKDAPADYEVGRGRPPAHSRFQRGRSGNPGGRKKESKNFKTILEAILASEIEITEKGRKRTATALEALITRQVHEGLKGELRAIENLLDRYERHVGSEPDREQELSEEDEAIIERLLALRGDRVSPPSPASDNRIGVDGLDPKRGTDPDDPEHSDE